MKLKSIALEAARSRRFETRPAFVTFLRGLRALLDSGPGSARLAGWAVSLSTLAATAATPLPVSTLNRTTAVDFEREVLPIFQRNCLACHNQTRAKADLVLETPAFIAKGGASGPSLIPGKGEESLVFRSAAHRVDDLVMPPVGNKSNAANLTADELGLLKLWIDQGGQGEVRGSRSLTWQPIPDSWNASYAVAIDRHSQLVACARANRVHLYDARTGRPAGRLEDPNLQGAAQRDIVSAIAFSPTEDIVATAGFQEVRLWKRRPAEVQEILRRDEPGDWAGAALSPDRSQIALLDGNGNLQIRRIDSGAVVTTWTSITSTPAQLAYSPDGSRVAIVGASGILRILSARGGESLYEHALGAEPLALAWFQEGRSLATVVQGAKTIQTWRFPENSEDRQMVPGSSLNSHEASISALTTDPSGLLVSASTDGVVLRWPTEESAKPSKIICPTPVERMQTGGARGLVLATLADGGSALLEWGEKPSLLRRFRGDPRPESAAAIVEHELALAQLELSYAEKSIQEAESESKKAAEALAKAREKREGQAKALEEKQQTLAKNQQSESAASQERDNLAAELQKALDESSAAEKAANEAKVAARDAADRAAAARHAAEWADRLKSDLERIVQSLAGRAEESAVTKAREAAESAAVDAAAKTRVTGETRSLADKALDEVATKSFAAGQKRALADRANAELPPRKKQAEEKLAAAKKAIADLQPQLEKARITLEGGDKDIQLADQAATRVANSLEQAKSAAETARRRIAENEARLKDRRSGSSTAFARRHSTSAACPSGTQILSLDETGALLAWDTASATATVAYDHPDREAIALHPEDETSVLILTRNRLERVRFAPRWDHFRTLGAGSSATDAGAGLVDRVNALAFSPDGTLLATGGGEPSRSGELKLWNVADGTLARDLGHLHSDCVLSIAFSPRGDRIATGGADRFARISEVSTGKLIRSLEGHTHHVMGVAWLAHGGVLASAGAEGSVKIWNPLTGDRLKNVDGFGKEVTGLRALGLTNQFVAVSGSGQGRVVRENGEKVRDLPGAPSFFESLATTADGKWAAVAADDGILRIWDVEAAKERFAISPP